MDNSVLKYSNVDDLIKKGVIRRFLNNGEETLEAVIYKGYYKADKFCILHVL